MDNLEKNNNWLHFIGIGGVTTAPLALALKQEGMDITGSDTTLYDPIKTFLENADIQVYSSYTYKNLMRKNSYPAAILVGSGISLKNKEYLFAQKRGIKILHFPHVLEELVVDNNSLVVAGSYAKTTITSLLVHMFSQANVDLSYMFGGLPVSNAPSIKLKNVSTTLSIVEGDEYIASRFDKKSKFFYYHPKYLVLTAVKWDHTDVFETREVYLDNFKELVRQVPENGLIFANLEDEGVLQAIKDAKCNIEGYYPSKLSKWIDGNNIQSKLLGDFNQINIAVAAFVALKLGVKQDAVVKAASDYLGIKRRLEIRKKHTRNEKEVIVIDDFASAPAKVESSINALRAQFPKHRLAIVFEPNTGSRTKQSLAEFKHVFDKADKVLLPNFTKLVKSDKYELDEIILAKYLAKENIQAFSFQEDKDLLEYIAKLIKEENKLVVAFLSSHGMEIRIQFVIDLLNEQKA